MIRRQPERRLKGKPAESLTTHLSLNAARTMPGLDNKNASFKTRRDCLLIIAYICLK